MIDVIYLLDLPKDIIVNILKNLSTFELCSKIPLVCKYFRALRSHPMLWECIDLGTMMYSITDYSLKSFSKWWSGPIKHLSLAGCFKVTDNGLLEMMKVIR